MNPVGKPRRHQVLSSWEKMGVEGGQAAGHDLPWNSETLEDWLETGTAKTYSLVKKEGTNIVPYVGLGVLLRDSSGEKDAGACLRVSVLEARMKPHPSPNWGNIRLA